MQMRNMSTLCQARRPRSPGPLPLPRTARRLGACELPDDDHFCALEALLMQLGVKEVALLKGGDKAAGGAGGSRLGQAVCFVERKELGTAFAFVRAVIGPEAQQTHWLML